MRMVSITVGECQMLNVILILWKGIFKNLGSFSLI